MSRKLVVWNEPDGSIWAVPAEFVAEHRASYYAGRECNGEECTHDSEICGVFRVEWNYSLNEDPDELTDWASNNMNFEDVQAIAFKLKEPQVHPVGSGWGDQMMFLEDEQS